jgi:predicted HTH domain antitoxin
VALLTEPARLSDIVGENAEEKVRLWAAVKGYEIGELSAGQAAQLAGLPKTAFLQKLGQFGVSVLEVRSAEELEQEIAVARRAAGR